MLFIVGLFTLFIVVPELGTVVELLMIIVSFLFTEEALLEYR